MHPGLVRAQFLLTAIRFGKMESQIQRSSIGDPSGVRSCTWNHSSCCSYLSSSCCLLLCIGDLYPHGPRWDVDMWWTHVGTYLSRLFTLTPATSYRCRATQHSTRWNPRDVASLVVSSTRDTCTFDAGDRNLSPNGNTIQQLVEEPRMHAFNNVYMYILQIMQIMQIVLRRAPPQ